MGEQFTIPAADAPAEEWGRLAVAIPGFTWTMPWASLPDEYGRVWRRNWCPRDSGFGWTQVCGPLRRDYRPTFEAVDPDDRGGTGCFLALLGHGCLVRVLPRESRPLVGIVIPSGLTRDGRPHQIGGHNLNRACIAAAAALGRWPGGAA